MSYISVLWFTLLRNGDNSDSYITPCYEDEMRQVCELLVLVTAELWTGVREMQCGGVQHSHTQAYDAEVTKQV